MVLSEDRSCISAGDYTHNHSNELIFGTYREMRLHCVTGGVSHATSSRRLLQRASLDDNWFSRVRLVETVSGVLR